MSRPRHFYTRISIAMALMLSILTLAIGGILFYWCFFTYANTFEDYRIDSQTEQDDLDRGIKNEWILGVSAHSIDLVEAVHGDAVAEHVLGQAESQVEAAKTYRETIDGKYLIYRIEVDTQNGERIYRYSVIKDIYLEHFPMMAAEMLLIVVGVFLVTFLVVRRIGRSMGRTIQQTSQSISLMAHTGQTLPLDVAAVEDDDLVELVRSFESTKEELDDQRALQQSTLQYISHELKTPVMIIKSYADSAREGVFPKGDLDSSLEVIERQVDRIQSRVADLLLVSRVETEYSNELPEEVDVSSILRGQAETFSRLYPETCIEMQVDDGLKTIGLPSQLSILIENLVINQFKYGHGRALIEAYRRGGDIVVDFANDGDPIPPDIREHLFDPFVRGESGGTGLGLAIARRIAVNHHGSICLVPMETGVIFELVLPVQDLSEVIVPADEGNAQPSTDAS